MGRVKGSDDSQPPCQQQHQTWQRMNEMKADDGEATQNFGGFFSGRLGKKEGWGFGDVGNREGKR